MLKEINIKVPEQDVDRLLGIVSVMLKHAGEDPNLNNNLYINNLNLNENKEYIDYLNSNSNSNSKYDFENYKDYYRPSYEEVVAYVKYKGYENEFNAEHFWKYTNDGIGWTFKNGNQMKRWTDIVDMGYEKNMFCGFTEVTEKKIPELPVTVIKPRKPNV